MKRIMIVTIAAAFAAASYVPGAMAGSEAANENRATMILESVRQEYNAGQRLEAIKNGKTSAVEAKGAQASEWLKRVDQRDVNMATNRVDKSGKRAFTLNGKTYFISGDKDAIQLSNNPSAGFAKDPVTERTINKADAVTFVDASGRVLYFESEETYGKFLGLSNIGLASK